VLVAAGRSWRLAGAARCGWGQQRGASSTSTRPSASGEQLPAASSSCCSRFPVPGFIRYPFNDSNPLNSSAVPDDAGEQRVEMHEHVVLRPPGAHRDLVRMNRGIVRPDECRHVAGRGDTIRA
jgi:hypothetical protein